MAKTKVSLIVLGILLLTSFIPVLQVFVMLINGWIIYPFDLLGIKDDGVLLYGVNAVFTLLFLVLFYFSNRIITKVLSALGVILFFLPLLLYATEGIINTERYYFLRFLIIGIIVGGVLFLIELLKAKIKAP